MKKNICRVKQYQVREKGAEGVDQKIKKATDRNRSSGRGRNRKTGI